MEIIAENSIILCGAVSNSFCLTISLNTLDNNNFDLFMKKASFLNISKSTYDWKDIIVSIFVVLVVVFVLVWFNGK